MASRKVVLHGKLAKEFGPEFDLYVETAGEAIRALHANFPGKFIEAMKVGSYQVVRGDPKTGMGLEEGHINDFRLGKADLHIIPVVEGSAGGGSKGGGIKAIAGIALIGVAVFMSGGTLAAPLAGMGAAVLPGTLSITWGTVALMGLALAVSGASSLLSKTEKPKDETKRDDGFAFSGPINVTEQGNPVPLIYGRVMTGGMPISSGIDIEDIGTFQGAVGSGVPGLNGVIIDGTETIVFSGTYNSVT